MRSRVVAEASRAELVLFLRDPVTLVFALTLPALFVLVMGAVFGDQPDPEGQFYGGVGGSTYYTPAYIGLAAASVGLISIPTQLSGYRENGVLRRMRASGLPASAVVAAQLAVGVGLALAGAIVVTVASFASSDPRPPDDVVGVAFAFVIGTVAMNLLGIALGALVPTARAAQGAGVLIWFVLIFVGGAGPPPEALPEAMDVLGSATPMRPLVRALQGPWYGDGWQFTALATLVGLGIVGWFVAAQRLRRD
jgi:ABC-2 type transport system permease protein